MALLKLHIDEAEDLDFHLLAIHTSLEDFRLAYFLNQKLQLGLCKNPDDIKISGKESHTFLSRFSFDDVKNEVLWSLIENENESTAKPTNSGQGLFAGSKSTFSAKGYLVPEFKKVNFFLKIDDANQTVNTTEIAARIKTIGSVSTAYFINVGTIKSKNNLIF